MVLIEIVGLDDGTSLHARFRSTQLRQTKDVVVNAEPSEGETHAQIVQRIKQELISQWQAWEYQELAKLTRNEVVGATWDGTKWSPPPENVVVEE